MARTPNEPDRRQSPRTLEQMRQGAAEGSHRREMLDRLSGAKQPKGNGKGPAKITSPGSRRIPGGIRSPGSPTAGTPNIGPEQKGGDSKKYMKTVISQMRAPFRAGA